MELHFTLTPRETFDTELLHFIFIECHILSDLYMFRAVVVFSILGILFVLCMSIMHHYCTPQ